MTQKPAPASRSFRQVAQRDDVQHRGWIIAWDYGQFSATGPDYDASYEGEEDGWVDNGHRVFARTRDGLIEEIDAWFEDRADASR